MVQLPLEYQSGDTLLADLNPDYYITDKKKVVAKLTANNAWTKPIQRIAPIDFIELSDTKFKELNQPYEDFQAFLSDNVQKHLPGQHDQSTHGGRKSYKSIDDLVKDGLSMQEAVDGLGGASVGNGNVAMRILLERTGKGGKPEVVASVADLDGEPIYRGVPTSGADSLVNADYDRIGTGQYGDGYYFSNQQGTAQLFADMAKEQFKGDKGEIVVAGWKKDAKVFNVQGGNMGWIDAATSAQNNAIDKLNINTRASDEQSAIFDLFYQDYGNSLATDLIMQGYDGMNIGINALESYTVVFNREALQVVGN
jgi:hypothetical protein